MLTARAVTAQEASADADRDAAFIGISKFNKVALDYHYDRYITAIKHRQSNNHLHGKEGGTDGTGAEA
jgi:hypothetical protein